MLASVIEEKKLSEYVRPIAAGPVALACWWLTYNTEILLFAHIDGRGRSGIGWLADHLLCFSFKK
jgi:hypothetical protein